MGERQLLDFLVRRQQVAFDALRQQPCAGLVQRDAVAAGPLGDPAMQLADLDRPGLDDRAVLLEGLEPGARKAVALQPPRDDQDDGVGWRIGGQTREHRAAVHAGPWRGQPDLEQALRREQRKRLAGAEHRAPIEPRLDEEGLALAETELAGARTHCVGGLPDQQWFIAGHQPERRDRGRGQLARQLFRPDTHGPSTVTQP